MIVSGQNPFTLLNMDTPSVFTWAQENKVSICVFIILQPVLYCLGSSTYHCPKETSENIHGLPFQTNCKVL